MKKENKKEKWISQQKLADDLGISVQRVHNWIKRGNIKSKKDDSIKMILVNPDTLKVSTKVLTIR